MPPIPGALAISRYAQAWLSSIVLSSGIRRKPQRTGPIWALPSYNHRGADLVMVIGGPPRLSRRDHRRRAPFRIPDLEFSSNNQATVMRIGSNRIATFPAMTVFFFHFHRNPDVR
jgi:hypothetical protein